MKQQTVYVYTKYGEDFAREHGLDERLENHLAYAGRTPLHMYCSLGQEWEDKGYVKRVTADQVVGLVTNEDRVI